MDKVFFNWALSIVNTSNCESLEYLQHTCGNHYKIVYAAVNKYGNSLQYA